MIVEINDVSKNYGINCVLNKVSFTVNSNEIVGIIGPNGSGKTTLLNVIMGLVRVDSGTVSINHKNQINAAVSRKGFFEDMSVLNNLKMYASLNFLPFSEVELVLGLFEIDFAKSPFGKLSAGMKQRVALALAFIGSHKLILLDEPTNHLDIDSILILRKVIDDTRKSGTAFLIASHILTELEKLCDRVLFIRKGKIESIYSMNEIERDYSSLEEAYLKISGQ